MDSSSRKVGISEIYRGSPCAKFSTQLCKRVEPKVVGYGYRHVVLAAHLMDALSFNQFMLVSLTSLKNRIGGLAPSSTRVFYAWHYSLTEYATTWRGISRCDLW
jgi:hypothetical protein